METIKFFGRNQRRIADEISKIVGKSSGFGLYSNALKFEIEDAPALAACAQDAEKYWKSLGKRSMAIAACEVKLAIQAKIANENYLKSFEKPEEDERCPADYERQFISWKC